MLPLAELPQSSDCNLCLAARRMPMLFDLSTTSTRLLYAHRTELEALLNIAGTSQAGL